MSPKVIAIIAVGAIAAGAYFYVQSQGVRRHPAAEATETIAPVTSANIPTAAVDQVVTVPSELEGTWYRGYDGDFAGKVVLSGGTITFYTERGGPTGYLGAEPKWVVVNGSAPGALKIGFVNQEGSRSWVFECEQPDAGGCPYRIYADIRSVTQRKIAELSIRYAFKYNGVVNGQTWKDPGNPINYYKRDDWIKETPIGQRWAARNAH